jgi:hypothetical protein
MGAVNGPDEQDALLRALSAPGSAAELAEEERYAAIFRSARDASGPGDLGPDEDSSDAVVLLSRRSRTPRRILAGGAAAAALAIATGGVAAAYTGNLPDPIQDLAHHVIGAPASQPSSLPQSGGTRPVPRAHPPAPSAPGTPAPPAVPRGHHPRHPGHPRHHASPPATPGTTPPPSAPATPTTGAGAGATPKPRPVVTGVSIAGTSHRADVGGRVVLTGRVSATGGIPARRQKVVLEQRLGKGWQRVAAGLTDAQGTVSLRTPPLQRTASFRLRSAAVHSGSWRVAMHPLLTASASTQKRVAVVTVRAQGGDAGDRVTLRTRRNGSLVTVATGRLGTDGSVTLRVAPAQKRTRYVVVLAQTGQHSSAQTSVVVVVRAGQAG